jgi:two-component system, NarL family, sensor kinase
MSIKAVRAPVALASLRATLVVVILLSERLIDVRRLGHSGFFVVLTLTAVYSIAGIVLAVTRPRLACAPAIVRAQSALDVLFLSGLAYTSGGAFSDVRKAFFVIPLAAAFSERPRSTATWSLLAVAAFSVQAAAAGGHPQSAINTWQRMTVNQDLYLAWTGAAAALLALGLRRRTAETEQLAASRQKLVMESIESVERERTRLAGALHDSPVQNLIAARHDLRRAERAGDPDSFARLHRALDITIAELREEIFKLHPHVLDHVGLTAALEQVARRHAGGARVKIEVDLETEPHDGDRQLLFALGRELLSNAAKHARASEIRLTVGLDGDGVALEVADDGRGIADGRERQALLQGHIGLAAVRERVAALGGTISIATSPDAGTVIRIRIPGWQQTGAEVSDRVTAGEVLRVSTT